MWSIGSGGLYVWNPTEMHFIQIFHMTCLISELPVGYAILWSIGSEGNIYGNAFHSKIYCILYTFEVEYESLWNMGNWVLHIWHRDIYEHRKWTTLHMKSHGNAFHWNIYCLLYALEVEYEILWNVWSWVLHIWNRDIYEHRKWTTLPMKSLSLICIRSGIWNSVERVKLSTAYMK